MKTLKTSLLLAALASATVITTAEARGGPEGGMRGFGPGAIDFETLDLDGDGSVTLEELQGQGAARFAEADTDGDGALSADELAARAENARTERLTRMIERLDTNEDGLIQLEELEAAREDRRGPGAEDLFARMDTNEDGVISAEEFEAARERMAERRGFGDRRGGHGHGGDGRRGG